MYTCNAMLPVNIVWNMFVGD